MTSPPEAAPPAEPCPASTPSSRLGPGSAPSWTRACSGDGALGEPAVAMDASGSAALAVTFQGSIDCGSGPVVAAGGPADFDALVAGIDPSGRVLWTRVASGSRPQALAAVAFDPWGGVLVAGSFAGTLDLAGQHLTASSELDVLVARFEPSGALSWLRAFGQSSRNFGVDIAVAPSGRIFLLARGATPIDLGAGVLSARGRASFVAVLDPRGRTLHSRALSGAGDVLATRLRPTVDGGALVLGRFKGTADFGTGPLTSDPSLPAYTAEGEVFALRLTSADPWRLARAGDARDLLGWTLGRRAIPAAATLSMPIVY
ncbi:MAG: hypothetical protein R3F14_11955 [Polyangiaceae bacterium]